MANLSSFTPGSRVVITALKGMNDLYRRRLLSMGFLPQTKLEIYRLMPLGDPMVIGVRGSTVCLRKSEAQHIEVEVINE